MALNKFYLQEDGASTFFSLDIVGGLDLDLPSFDYKAIKLKGEGSFLDGVGVPGGREISCSYNFKNNDEEDRENFLDFFTRSHESTQWLYKDVRKRIRCNITNGSTQIVMLQGFSQLSTGNSVIHAAFSTDTIIEAINSTTIDVTNAATQTIANEQVEFQTFLGRLRAFCMPSGGESYEDIAISENIDFTLFSEMPYFESTVVTNVTVTSTTFSEFETTSVNIKGRRVPATYSFLSSGSTAWDLFQVKTADGFGFRANIAVTSTQTIAVKTSESKLVATIDGLEQSGVFSSTSTPFFLERGNNHLFITGTQGTLTISYNERRL